MFTCIRIPVVIPQEEELQKNIFKTIIGTFLHSWSATDAANLTVRSVTGHSDTHFFIERPPDAAGNHRLDVCQVFIKLHNDEDASIIALESLVPRKEEEAQLVAKFGQTGYGPRFIGFFQTEDGIRGRIDEMLDSRTLESEDVEDKSIRADIARAYASLHSLQVSGIQRRPVDSYYDAIIHGLSKYHKMQKLKQLGMEGGVNIDQVVDYDFSPRIRLIADGMRSINAKEGWCMHDVQYGNILVKTSPKADEPKAALIDFEFVFQNFRAVDIGGHWFQKRFKWTDEQSKIIDCRPYTDEEKQHFCEVYAEKWNDITGDKDTGEQVYAEASLGYTLALVFDIHFMLMAMDEDDNDDPLDAQGLNKLFEEFEKSYDNAGLIDLR